MKQTVCFILLYEIIRVHWHILISANLIPKSSICDVTAWRSSSSFHDVKDNNTVFLVGSDRKADYALTTLSGNTVLVSFIQMGSNKKDYRPGPLSFPSSFYCCYMHVFLNQNVNISSGCELFTAALSSTCVCFKTPTHKVFASKSCLSRCFVRLSLRAEPDSALPEALIFWAANVE